jgi:hypothetical protein
MEYIVQERVSLVHVVRADSEAEAERIVAARPWEERRKSPAIEHNYNPYDKEFQATAERPEDPELDEEDLALVYDHPGSPLRR